MKQLLLLVLACLTLTPAWAQKGRSYTAERFGLELEGKFVGWLKSAEGGTPTAEVVQERGGKKHLGTVRYEPITIEVGIDLLPLVSEWLKAAPQGKRRSGAIVFADYNYKMVERLEFVNALLTGLTLPDLDAASKDMGILRLTFLPELTRRQEATGAVTIPSPGKAKLWVTSNFRLSAPGLDTARISKTTGIGITMKPFESAVGQRRDYLKEPGPLEVTDFTLTLPIGNADTFYAWLQDFVVKGNSGEGQEKELKLELLDSALQSTLATVVLRRVGIYRIVPGKPATTTLPTVTFQFYAEELELIPGAK